MNKRYGFIIDQERCIGCDACTVACEMEHKIEKGYIKVDTQDSELKDDPHGKFPELQIRWLPKLCNHCKNPPCLDSCPEDAIYKRDDGIVIINELNCTGCKTCVEICPYGAININAKKNKAEKCDLCGNRVDQGLEPFCVICCEGQAIYFGDFNDPESDLSKIIAERDHFRLKPELGTGPSIYYLPPMKKRKL
jgi:tetrathionate reductase subunit B